MLVNAVRFVQAGTARGTNDLARAQCDFLELHLAQWIAPMVEVVCHVDAAERYATLVLLLRDFVAKGLGNSSACWRRPARRRRQPCLDYLLSGGHTAAQAVRLRRRAISSMRPSPVFHRWRESRFWRTPHAPFAR